MAEADKEKKKWAAAAVKIRAIIEKACPDEGDTTVHVLFSNILQACDDIEQECK